MSTDDATRLREAKETVDRVNKMLGRAEHNLRMLNSGQPFTPMKGTAYEGHILNQTEMEEILTAQIRELQRQLVQANELVAHIQGLALLPEPLRSRMRETREQIEQNRRKAGGVRTSPLTPPPIPLDAVEGQRRAALDRIEENRQRMLRGERSSEPTFKEPKPEPPAKP